MLWKLEIFETLQDDNLYLNVHIRIIGELKKKSGNIFLLVIQVNWAFAVFGDLCVLAKFYLFIISLLFIFPRFVLVICVYSISYIF